MIDFNFFDSSFESEDGLLLEKLDIKHESMTEMRFKRFFTKLILGAKLIDKIDSKTYSALGTPKLDLSVKSLKVPTKPRREKNPLTKETLQSYTVKVELSDGQKVQMLVQFEGEGKLGGKTTGVVGEIKLNGQVIPLTAKDANSADLTSVIKKLLQGLAENASKYKAKAEKKAAKEAADAEKKKGSDLDTDNANDRTTKISHDEESEELRRRMGDKTGGGLDDEGGAPKPRLSKKKQLEAMKETETSLRSEIETVKNSEGSLMDRIEEQEKRISELTSQIATANQTLANLANQGGI